MRAPCADNNDERGAAWRGSRRNGHGRDALRHGGTLLKPEWLTRRMPPNTPPAQQATGETHTTGGYSCLLPPQSPAAYDGRHPGFVCELRYGESKTRCGTARSILRSFRGERND